MEQFSALLASAGDVLSDNLGLIAAVTGLVAAIAGLWSARAAAVSARHAQDVDRRAQLRHVVATAQNIIAESTRVEDLSSKLTMAYRTLFTFSGGTGSSRLRLYLDEVEQLKQEALPLREEAEKHMFDQKELRKLSEDDLVGETVRLDGHLLRVRVIKEKLDHDLKDVESQNATYREQVIKRTDKG
jgi:hypothetical protein